MFLLFTLIFITTVGLSAISAAENTSADIDDTTLTSEDTSSIESTYTDVSNTKQISKDSNKNIKSEAGQYTITDTTYDTYFNTQGILNNTLVENDSTITLSGSIANKNFIFDNAIVTVNTDGTSTLYNTTIITQNNAQVVFDGLTIDNTNSEDYVILLESDGNTLSNSNINVVSVNPLHAIEVTGNSTNIINTTITVEAPSAAVVYDANWVGHPAASALYITSSNNNVEDTQVYYTATATTDYYPSADGIDIQSEGNGFIAENNTIKNTIVAVNGTNYVYGINVGRTKNSILEDVNVTVYSDYYTNAIQLFDGESTVITGNLTSNAGTEAYAVYSTAMGTGYSKDITVVADMTVEAPIATGVLIEGSSDILIDESTFNIEGQNASATRTYVDWMGNQPSNFTLANSNITINGENSYDVIYFGLCDDVVVYSNYIESNQNSYINITNTTNARVTDNYIKNGAVVGDNAVVTNTNDTIIANNTPTIITDDTYSQYFDEYAVLNNSLVEDGIALSGPFYNKDFIFDNIEIKVTTTDDAVLYNATVISQNGAKVEFDGLVIDNTDTEDYAVLLESEGNTLKNSIITVDNTDALHAVEVTGDNNTLTNVTVNLQAPSAPVVYDKNWVGHPASSAIYVTSSNNVIEDSTVNFNAIETDEQFPSADGIDIQSEGYGIVSENNTIRNTTVNVNGTDYVYGINVGRAKNTTVDDVTVDVYSDYYTNAIQLFDADGITITGDLTSVAGTESYGVYSTAMGTGYSQNINIIDTTMNVESPQATGVLIEGSSDILIDNCIFDIEGENASATRTYVDWMGNQPSNFTLTNSEIYAEGTIKNDIIYFGLCDDVTVDSNSIITTQRSNINVTNTTNAAITNNYIINNDTGMGDYAVVTNSNDTIIENNTPISPVVEDYEEQIDKLLNPDDVNTTITITPIEASVGETINITATIKTVDDEAVTGGKVVFKINGQTLKDEDNNPIYAYVNNGVATAKYTVPATWTKSNLTIDAVYSGYKQYQSSRTSVEDIITVNKTGVEITLDETEITTKSGQTIKVVSTVKDTFGNSVNGGKLLYKLNGVTIGTSEVKDGLSILTYTIPDNYSAKTYTLTVDYISNYYERTSTNATLTIEKKETNINPDEVSIVDNKTTIKATITDETGATLTRSTNVVVKVNGKTMTSTTSQNGIIDVSFDNTFKAQTFTLLIISGENGIYKSTRTTMTLTKE